MLPKNSKLRIVRATDRLDEVSEMYMKGLGFEILGQFQNHQGFDGVILGHREHPYHLEFTHHRGATVGKAPTKDNLLVFYVPNGNSFSSCCSALIAAGFRKVVSHNPYWERTGATFEDLDGYRVVIQNGEWSV